MLLMLSMSLKAIISKSILYPGIIQFVISFVGFARILLGGGMSVHKKKIIDLKRAIT